MTKAQQRKVDLIRRQAEKEFSFTELKRLEVTENEYFVAVFAQIGLPNDEGTYASIFARDSVHVFIGKRGGMKYPVTQKLKNGKYRHFYRPYKSFLATSIDQRI